MSFDYFISYDYHDPETFTGWELSLGSNINVGVESLQGRKPAIPLRTPICAMSLVLRDLQQECSMRWGLSFQRLTRVRPPIEGDQRGKNQWDAFRK